MVPAGGVCRLCGSQLGYAENKATLKVSRIVACPHCDSVCRHILCAKCARMNRTVRVIEKPPPEAA